MLLSAVAICRADDSVDKKAPDPHAVCVMCIDGVDINMDEFCYHYRKTLLNGGDIVSPRDFATQFALFKMKVMEAEKCGLDTLPTFVNELNYYAGSIGPDEGMLLKEYHDGMLLYEISSLRVWNPALLHPDILQQHFESCKEKYQWDTPRAKGWVIYANDETTLAEVTAYLDSNLGEGDDVKDCLRSHYGPTVFASRFLIREGVNPVIDSLVFRGQKISHDDSAWRCACAYRCAVINAPQEWLDVKGEVTEDYQRKLAGDWEQDLWSSHNVQFFYDAIDEVAKV